MSGKIKKSQFIFKNVYKTFKNHYTAHAKIKNEKRKEITII